MSLTKRTPARVAANRANGCKSRGPKTPGGKRLASLNALKNGAAPQAATRPMWQTMTELGEDPGRYRSLLQGVLNSYPPWNAIELRVCEDITRLLLKSERNQQAQEAKLVRTYEKLESAREKQVREIERRSSYDALQAVVLETGLRRAPDSPAKFFETTACLERLRERVERADFSDETELDALYGKNRTFRGAGVTSAFRALAQNPKDRDLAASLRLMLLEELRDVAAEGQLYYREHVAISRAMRLECLAPAADPEYILLQRHEDALHRQLERKIRLLISLQGGATQARKRASEPAAGLPALEDEPLGWLGSSAFEKPPAPGAAVTRAAGRPRARHSDASAIALRHKISTLPVSKKRSAEEHAEMLRQINEIYGITAPEPAAAHTGFAASNRMENPDSSAGRGAPGSPLIDSRPDADEQAEENGGG